MCKRVRMHACTHARTTMHTRTHARTHARSLARTHARTQEQLKKIEKLARENDLFREKLAEWQDNIEKANLPITTTVL